MAKILFIEDEVKFQKSFMEFFSREGLEVIPAYDGVSGLKMAEENMPDLIILDLVLPKKDGFEVLKEIKTNALLQKIPIIVLTNLEGAEDIERVMKYKVQDYLVKANYSLQEILGVVKKYVPNSNS